MATSFLTTPIVTLRQGIFRGTTTSPSKPFPQLLDLFLGIPYALSPTGSLRFRPPVHVAASTETFNATHWGPRCPGSFGQPSDPDDDEDCLNLNVFRPRRHRHEQTANAKLKLLPVLIYVHGGSFNFGDGRTVGLESMVGWSTEPFIGVSFNYRLGALGFLSGKVMAGEGALNVGLRDQALALEWVNENIEAFGGDPGHVTLMGCSAGAHSVGHHLMANTSKKPLFRKAIMDSGAPTARAVHAYDHPLHETQFEEFLQATGGSSLNENQIMPHLRSLPVSTLVSASLSIFGKYDPSLRWPFQPVLEGSGGYISRPPIEAWRSGDWHKMPILTGFTTNEGAVFVPKTMSKASEFLEFFSTLRPELSMSDLDTLESLYENPITHPYSSPYVEIRNGLGAQFKRVAAAYGQYAYIAPVRHTAYFASAVQSAQAPVYLYHFDLKKSIYGGAGHADQMGFVWYNSNIVEAFNSHEEIAGKMHDYYTSFIVSGNPNAIMGRWPDRPHWPAYRAGEGQRMVFGQGNTEWIGGTDAGIPAMVVPDGYAKKQCDFWWSKVDIVEGERKEKL